MLKKQQYTTLIIIKIFITQLPLQTLLNFYINRSAVVHIFLWILDRVYGLIFPVKVYILHHIPARLNINFDREHYESIYPVKNVLF
jgi:hypothetical protein